MWLLRKSPYIIAGGALAYGAYKTWEELNEDYGPTVANTGTLAETKVEKAALKSTGNYLKNKAITTPALEKNHFKTKFYDKMAKDLDALSDLKILKKTGKAGEAATKGLQTLAQSANKTSRALNITSYSTNSTTKTMARLISQSNKELGLSAKLLSKLGDFAHGTGKTMGIVGDVLVAGMSGYEAYNHFQAGENKEGYQAIGRGAGSIGGWYAGSSALAPVGAWGGTLISPGLGTAIGSGLFWLLGGILGSIIGAEGIEWLTGKAYDNLATPKSESLMLTETPSALMNNPELENHELMKRMADSLERLELSLDPQVQKDIDNAFIDNVSREFSQVPMAPETNYFNDYMTLSTTWKKNLNSNS